MIREALLQGAEPRTDLVVVRLVGVGQAGRHETAARRAYESRMLTP